MKEKLQEYALLAEILSAFAVVASLIFVGMQIRQQSDETALNTRAVEITAYQNLIEQISLLNTLVIESGEFAKIRRTGLSGSDFENEEDQSRFSSYVNLLVRHGDLAYRQFENGLITDDDLRSVLRPLTLMMSSEKVKQGWEFLVPGLKPEYVDYVTALVEGDT